MRCFTFAKILLARNSSMEPPTYKYSEKKRAIYWGNQIMSTAVLNSKCILTVYDNTAYYSSETICDVSDYDMENLFLRVPKKTR